MTAPAAPPDRLRRLRALGRLLDSSIPVPGTRWRFGVDSLLGLVPGVGDAAGAALAGYLVLQAARLGAPPPTLARMLGNVLLDMTLGAIPLLGDLFDAGYKANLRNLRLLEAHLADPARAARASRRRVLAAAVAIATLLVLVGGAVAWAGLALARALGA